MYILLYICIAAFTPFIVHSRRQNPNMKSVGGFIYSPLSYLPIPTWQEGGKGFKEYISVHYIDGI